jgi:hypothetical protein
MDHNLAHQTSAAIKYLLDELTAAQRLEFEEHLFDCPICSEQVSTDAVIVDNLKEVLREEPQPAGLPHSDRPAGTFRGRYQGLFGWLWRPATLVPTLATLALASIVGYQNLVSIPSLLRPQALATFPIASAVRGGGQIVSVDRRQSMLTLSFEVDSPRAYPSYICDFEREGQGSVLQVGSGERKVASFSLVLLLPAKRFSAGHYVMILRPAGQPQTEIERYPFVIQDEDIRP